MKAIDREKQEVVGRWLIDSDGYYPYCSICLKEPKNGIMTEECPNCKTKMVVENKYANINVYGLKPLTNADKVRSMNDEELK